MGHMKLPDTCTGWREGGMLTLRSNKADKDKHEQEIATQHTCTRIYDIKNGVDKVTI